jgi:hypothetical protein
MRKIVAENNGYFEYESRLWIERGWDKMGFGRAAAVAESTRALAKSSRPDTSQEAACALRGLGAGMGRPSARAASSHASRAISSSARADAGVDPNAEHNGSSRISAM